MTYGTSMSEWTLMLANRILYMCNTKGFMSAITEAERSYGKSTYNLKNMAYVHHILDDLSEKDAWLKALDCMIFTPNELMNRVEYNINNDIISPVWCIDDATVHFSSYLYFINLYEASLLNATFDTIRTVVSTLLLTCPKRRRLLAGLRHYDDYNIVIYKDRGYQRKAVAIKWYSLPDGKQRYRKEFEDHFSCYIPNWIYGLYMEKRKKYLKEISDDLKRLKEKLEEKMKRRIAKEVIV